MECSNLKYRVRRLMPIETWRLMGFTDEDFEKSRQAMNKQLYRGKDRSGTQLYKQAGNSIVVDVLLHIMEELHSAMPYLFEEITVGSFFSGIGAFEKALSQLQESPTRQAYEEPNSEAQLTQLGFINGSNATANRVYDNKIAVTLKADAGGGRSKDRVVQSLPRVQVNFCI